MEAEQNGMPTTAANEKQQRKSSFFSLESCAKILAFVTVITATFGLCYQKGAIAAMHLGNLSGNYAVEEIFNSALAGYLYLFYHASKQDITDIVLELFGPLFSVVIVVAIVPFLVYKNRLILRVWARKAKSIGVAKAKKMHGITQFLLTCVGAFVASVLLLIVQICSLYTLLALFAVLLVPAALGYSIGANEVAEAIESPPCVHLSTIGENQERLWQCTHVVINGKLLKGKLLLENNSGYYMRLNEGFIYASKDGENCIYSKDVKRQNIDPANFVFLRGQIEDFCGIAESGKEATVPAPTGFNSM